MKLAMFLLVKLFSLVQWTASTSLLEAKARSRLQVQDKFTVSICVFMRDSPVRHFLLIAFGEATS